MPKRVEYSRAAAKALTRIDQATSRRIRAKVEQLATDPASLANNVKRLKGTDDLFRLRIGDWRIIYSEDLVVLLVLNVSPRGSAYD
ncbi:MAG TPA: type II toxin-antitoxin system RelE/ParE family toxin [Sphingomicrobium sp.]|nr:type II toxin-antitoxin system RelE/ParE family toxin [Sphingomicrobium sp.]